MALDHLPEAPGIRKSRHAFKNDLRGTGRQRPIGHIGVAGDPTDVGSAPENIAGLQVKGPVHGQFGPQQVAGGGMLHAFGLAGGAGGVEDEQRMLCVHSHRRAGGALASQRLGKGLVAPGNHVAGRGRALIDQHVLDGVATAHGQAFVDDGFEGQLFAAAHLEVGGDDGDRTRVDDAFVQSLGGKAAEHHAVGGADAGAGLHGDHALNRHGHVDQDPVAAVDAAGFQRIGKLADAGQQLLVADAVDGAVVGLKDDGSLVFDRRAHMAVQAIGAGVELAIVKPAVKGGVGFVQGPGERLVPNQVVARQGSPETFQIGLGAGAHGVIAVHAGNPGGGHHGRLGMEDPVLDQDRFNRRC